MQSKNERFAESKKKARYGWMTAVKALKMTIK